MRKAVKKAEVEQLCFKEVRAVTTFEEQELRRRLSEPMLGGVAETHHRLARVVVRPQGGGREGGIDDCRQQHRSSQEGDCSFDQNRSSINIHDIYSDELSNQIKHNLGDFLRSCQRSSFYGPLSPSIRYFSYDKGPATLSDSALKPRRRDSTAREDSINLLPNLYINEHLFVDGSMAVPGDTEDGSMSSPVSEDSAADNEGTTDRHHDDGDAGDGDDGDHGDDRGKGVTGMDPDSNNDACGNIHAKDETPCNNDVSTDERNDDAAVLDERNDDATVKEEGNEGERIAEGDDAVAAAGMEEVEGGVPEELLLVDVDFDLPNMVQQLIPYRPPALSTSDLLNLTPTAAGDEGSDAAALQPYLNYRRKRVKEKLQHLESIDKDDYGGGGGDKGGEEGPQSMRETIQQAVRGVGDLGATQKKYVWERGSGANYFDIEHTGRNIPKPTQKSTGHDRLDLEQLPRRPLTFILPAAPVDADEQWSGPYSYYSDHRHSNSNSLSPSKMKKVKEIYDEIELHNLSIYSATKSRARRAAQTSKYFEYSTSMVSNSAASMVSDSSTTAAEELTAFEPSTLEEVTVECPADSSGLDKSSLLPHRRSASSSKSAVVVSSSSSRSSEKRKDLRSSLHNHGMGQIGRHGSSSRRRNSSIEINGKLSIDGNKGIHPVKNSKIDSRSNSTSSIVARSNSSHSTSVKTDYTADSRRSLGSGISQPVESGMRGLRPHVNAKDADLLLVVQQLRASVTTV